MARHRPGTLVLHTIISHLHTHLTHPTPQATLTHGPPRPTCAGRQAGRWHLPRRGRRIHSSSSHSTCPPSGWWRWRCWSCAPSSCPRPRSRPRRPAAGRTRRSHSGALRSRGHCETARRPVNKRPPHEGHRHGTWPMALCSSRPVAAPPCPRREHGAGAAWPAWTLGDTGRGGGHGAGQLEQARGQVVVP